MNHSKQLLSYLRQDIFAHPDEIGAIERAMAQPTEIIMRHPCSFILFYPTMLV
jgi:hypothetical protein